mmetsp:Transcript_30713/g.43584  ORF Transcript_30713/g.43584 Transcript_30713/m.43584 type:complete len:208 (+) Transcript_30713:148-771(+)|eukprot:CAMPEP_0202458602 /NCGR_PEP_ID=MMETSP1360-20130828/26482_1 /ASSEMBLY_ACC=CAM_ASM_000848 /TAXON_ID=515479 /ORGANISM="Licmophora paradoxa, Strain CCMP2313" /LENGTH=207 /DNA_ID=CAMNT_0049079219 /DNA_START=51 /DNA_END=674 /DNA_ORIENTATION=-
MADEDFADLPPHLANIVPKKGGRRRGSSNYAGGDAIAQYKASTPGEETMTAASKQSVGELLEGFPQGDRKPSAQPQMKVAPPPIQAPMPPPAPPMPPAPAPAPAPAPPVGPAVKRGSVALQPISGVGGLVDFNDSDFDDSDDEDSGLPGAPLPANMPSGSHLPGGQNHRPLIGGFAAAAYEAAKAHHYANIKKPPHIPKRTGPPPSI